MTNAHWPEKTRGINPVTLDSNFERFLKRVNPAFHTRRWNDLVSFGEFAATTFKDQADYSDRIHPPVLTHDLTNPVKPGTRRGVVHLNDRYLDCQQEVYRRGFVSSLFDAQQPESQLFTFAAQYILGDIPSGCPLAMTHPVALAIEKYGTPETKALFMKELKRTDGQTKTAGTWGTEPPSGTDIARTLTEVVPQDDGTLRMHGLKWFTSNAGSGLALATARLRGAGDGAEGIGLYIVPSHIDDEWAIRNEYEVTHLKEKLGTRALATGEIRLDGALVYELVAPPHGMRAMMEVLNCSRVHNAVGSAGVIREALMETMCWTTHRTPFGKPLIDQIPTQKRVIAMHTQWMAASALAFESALSYDLAIKGSDEDNMWMRMVTALAKFRTAEQAEWATRLAKILHGGGGYVEDYPITRINRDSQVLSVWEGPEQVQAKELIRMIGGKMPGDAVFIKRLRAIADSLPDATMGMDKANLNTRLRFLEDSFSHFRTLPKAAADQVEDEYLDIMSHVLAYGLLLKEAAWELLHEKDAKKHLTAQHYFDTTLARVKMAPDFQPSVLQSHFDSLNKGTKIPSP